MQFNKKIKDTLHFQSFNNSINLIKTATGTKNYHNVKNLELRCFI